MARHLDYDRYRIEPLTKEAAKAMGHIAWIESDSATDAIRQMNNSVNTKPINCAVWADADASLTSEFRSAVSTWRAKTTLESTHGNPKSGFSFAGAVGFVSHYFQSAARGMPDDEKVLQMLENHIQSRLSALKTILNAKKYNAQVRLSGKTRDDDSSHADGADKNRIRFLESLESASTYLVSNDDVFHGLPPESWATHLKEFGYDQAFIDRDMKRKDWWLKTDQPITFYEAPQNSLIQITNKAHPWQPIMHAFPFAKKDEAPQPRTVLCYDLGKR